MKNLRMSIIIASNTLDFIALPSKDLQNFHFGQPKKIKNGLLQVGIFIQHGIKIKAKLDHQLHFGLMDPSVV